jgi:hypothetical protein
VHRDSTLKDSISMVGENAFAAIAEKISGHGNRRRD